MKKTVLYVLDAKWSENYSNYLSMPTGYHLTKICNNSLIEEMKRNLRKIEEN